jgi:hypothetical protein
MPTITNTPAATNPEGLDYAETMEATGTPVLVWSLTTAPVGATINSSTGLIGWVPEENSVRTIYDFTAKVLGPGGSDTLSWEVCVTAPQMTGDRVVEPALVGAAEMGPAQTLESEIEPVQIAETTMEPAQIAETDIEPALAGQTSIS